MFLITKWFALADDEDLLVSHGSVYLHYSLAYPRLSFLHDILISNRTLPFVVGLEPRFNPWKRMLASKPDYVYPSLPCYKDFTGGFDDVTSWGLARPLSQPSCFLDPTRDGEKCRFRHDRLPWSK